MSVRAGIVFSLSLAAAVLFAGAGCTSGKSKVRGKVTLNSKTVVWGTVTLIDKHGHYHQADIDLNGQYEINHVPEGTVKISVVSPNPSAAGRPEPGKTKGGRGGPGLEDAREKFMAGKEKADADRPKPPPGAWFPIPEKYNRPEDSGMKREVKGAQFTLDIELR